MTIDYKTSGPSSTRMRSEVDDGGIQSLDGSNGCDGNLQGLSRLVAGMRVEDVIARLEGISCGGKPTSCPDQLAKALKQSLYP